LRYHILSALCSRNYRIILTAVSLIEWKGSLLKCVSATWLISFGIDPYLSSDRQKDLIAPTRMLATWVLVSLEDDVALQSTPVCYSGIERARAVLALTTQSHNIIVMIFGIEEDLQNPGCHPLCC